MGGRFDYTVDVITVKDSHAFVAGFFTYIDSLKVNNIAAWDGSSWHSLGDGFTSESVWGSAVLDVGIDGDDVYAVGRFDSTGPTTTKNVAVWSEGSWHALGSGTNREMGAVAVGRDYVYFGSQGLIEADSISSQGLIAWKKAMTTSVDDEGTSMTTLHLYPNPFSREATIELEVESPTEGSVNLVDMLGRSVLTVFRGGFSAGVNRFTLQSADLAAGIYFIVVETPTARTTVLAIQR